MNQNFSPAKITIDLAEYEYLKSNAEQKKPENKFQDIAITKEFLSEIQNLISVCNKESDATSQILSAVALSQIFSNEKLVKLVNYNYSINKIQDSLKLMNR